MRPQITVFKTVTALLLALVAVGQTASNPSKPQGATPCNCVNLAFRTPPFTAGKHSVSRVTVDPTQWTFPQNAALVFTNHQDHPLPQGVTVGGYQIGFDGTLTIDFINPGPVTAEVEAMTWFSTRVGTGSD